MKIPTTDLFERQRRQSDRAILERQAGTRARNRARGRLSSLRPRTSAVRIALPKVLRFHGTYEIRMRFASFVERVEDVLRDGRGARLDFSEVELLNPCGLLLLMGHVRAWSEAAPGRLFGVYPKNEVVEEMLQSVGVLKLLGLPERVSKISHSDVTQWRYYTGTRADAQEMAPFMEEVRLLIGVDRQSFLYDSVVEAITNVRQHAYGDGLVTPWWMFATISGSNISVAIYDRGNSIPATLLEKPGVRERVDKWIAGRKKVDATLIQAAVGGRSSTRLPYRGKGLPEMLESTKAMPGSTLGIYSREGVYTYDQNSNKASSHRLDVPIVGSLIFWKLIVPEVKQ